jgi:hypothetical protein
MLIKLAVPTDGVTFSLGEYLQILRADAAAWSVPEILLLFDKRRIA